MIFTSPGGYCGTEWPRTYQNFFSLKTIIKSDKNKDEFRGMASVWSIQMFYFSFSLKVQTFISGSAQTEIQLKAGPDDRPPSVVLTVGLDLTDTEDAASSMSPTSEGKTKK